MMMITRYLFWLILANILLREAILKLILKLEPAYLHDLCHFWVILLKTIERMAQENKASSFLVKIIIGGISVLIAEFFLSGVHIDSWVTGFLLAAILILINLTIKPLMIVLTLPLTLITFGLFLLVINALVIMLADKIIPGFQVDGFWWALLFAVVLSIINSLFGNNLNSD